MADQSFIEKQDDGGDVSYYSVSYKIRKIGFPIAIILCVLLLVICIVLAILYSQAGTKPSVTPVEIPKHEICGEDRCFLLGRDMVNNMNEKIDPCKDFYAYACQGWQKRNPVKNDSYNSVTESLNKKTAWIIKKALETARYNYPKNAAVLKTVRFYDSCLNVTASDALGLQPLEDLIQQYGGWSVSSNYDASVTLTTRIGKAIRDLDVTTLFSVYVDVDEFDSKKRILKLGLASTELWTKSYFKKNNISEEIRQAYKKLLKTVGRMFGSNSSDIDDKMMAIYEFEKSIAKISAQNDSDDEDELNYHRRERTRVRRSSSTEDRTTLLSLCNSSGLPCSILQETLGVVFKRNFTGSEEVFLYRGEDQYIKSLYQLLVKTNESVVTDYIMWRIIRHYIEALPSIYNSTVGEFSKTAYNETRTTPRWKECYDSMHSTFDMTLGLLYVEVAFEKDPKKKIETMFEGIRSIFIDRLESDTWMDAQTKENAKKKALAMIADIAYPSFIKTPLKLKELYKSLHITDNFFSNFKETNHFNVMENLNTYGMPVDRHKWAFDYFYFANGMYFSKQNKITILAGLIQPPLYSFEFPWYLRYGGVGMVIGHEITHGFDGNGRKYDSNGNKKEWWSKFSEHHFKKKAECFVKQYNQYEAFGIHVNGSYTLNENMADNGGIQLAYEAYQLWTKKNGIEKILPGLNLSPDQLFFLGFAQGWCSVFSARNTYEYMKYDTHTLPEYRIIGSLSNFNKFADAYNCPADSPMNPRTKCGLW